MSENVPLTDQQLYGINNVPLDLYKWIRKNSYSFKEKYKELKNTDKHRYHYNTHKCYKSGDIDCTAHTFKPIYKGYQSSIS